MRATSSLLKKVAQSNPSPRYAAALPGGAAPAGVLRNLVSLHHQSATFMRSPEEIPTIFEQTFRYQRPEYEHYMSYKQRTMEGAAERGDAGIERMAERAANGLGARRAGSFQPARLSRNLFRDPDPYARESNLSEREMRVKETLFGTWERDGAGRHAVRPSLDGVIDIAERRGGVAKVAKEWKGQEDEGSTEDGM